MRGLDVLGLEKIWEELDSARRRTVRLVELERLDEEIGSVLADKILALLEEVDKLLEERYGRDGHG